MKLRRITLNNVRRFTDPAGISGIDDGLNVLCEPNEHGKSTLFDALQALFFKPHGSRDKDVVSLRPHAGGAPEVTVEVETGGGSFSIAKRWLSKPSATVHRAGTLIAQADAAEAWIADLLGGDGGGPSGLIWVRQGMTDLTGGSAKERQVALEARRDLMTSVGEEVDSMTGGRRMDMALSRCRDDLAVYVTATGRPKSNGPWKAAQEDVETLAARRDTLVATVHDLHEALAQRKRTRRDLQTLEAPEAVEARRTRLQAARAAHAAAEHHAEEVEAEARKVEMARLTFENARTRRDAFRETLAEHDAAASELDTTARKASARQDELAAQRATRDAADRAFEAARATLQAAEEARNMAVQAQAAKDGAARRRELADRIKGAEKTRSAMEQAAAAARNGPDPATMRRIEALAAACASAIAARDATSTQVVAHYSSGCDGTIRADGVALAQGHPRPVQRVTRLTIDGVGALEVRPGEAGHDDESVRLAHDTLRKALDDAGADDLDAARTNAAARAEAERQHGEASAVLASLAPDGIDRLREALARIPALDPSEKAPDPEAAEAALAAARDAYETARITRDTAAERLSDIRAEATRTETALASLRDRLARARGALARFDDGADAADAADAAAAQLEAARAVHAEKAQAAPDLAHAQAQLTRAESVETRAQEDIAHHKLLLARLDERIARSSGDGVEERLAETDQALEAARASLDGIEHEIAVLTRLETALQAARDDARDRYFTPIATELRPLLHLLWPDATLTWGEESLLPHTLIRNGQEEPIDILSGGTREQVALLVRLAFARMLSQAGRVAPVILDDALVFTDDDRIEAMFDALHRQAGDLQIIVLTCRQRAFRDLGGNVLRLSDAESGAAGAASAG